MIRIILTFFAFTAFALSSIAQNATNTTISSSLGLYVFPAKGQDAATQDADETACYKWAKEQTGYDPMNPTKVQVQAAEIGPDGSAVVGGAKGAAAGAAIGAIAGDAGKGAAIGAVVGGLAGRRARLEGEAAEQHHNEAAAQAQEQKMVDDFKKAFSACMDAKNYTVK